MRQIVLDTETTGLEPSQGHKIIEIGCVELNKRKPTGNHFQRYLNPDRAIDEAAVEVHGITTKFLQNKQRFLDVVDEFIEFVRGAELIIHNAAFDIGFLNHELALASKLSGRKLGKMSDYCKVLDTLAIARKKHPGQKNNLDALCRRYGIDNSNRQLHGALLDSEILAEVYIIMTGGQVTLALSGEQNQEGGANKEEIRRLSLAAGTLRVIRASDEENAEHEKRMDAIDKASDGSVWRSLESSSTKLQTTE